MNIGKDGYYRTSFRFGSKTYTVVGKTEAEVHQKVGKKRAELEAGVVKPTKLTLRQYAKEWHDTYYKDDTWYSLALSKHIIPDLGDYYMADITEEKLQKFLNRKAEKYSKSYIMRMKLCLRQMFRKAKKNHIIQDDPSEDLVIPECKEGHRRSLTDQERALLLEATKDHRGKLFVRCMLYCGLRPQEASVLQWKHIDLDAGIMHICQARKQKSGEIGPPKSASGVRDIPIPAVLLEDLKQAQGLPDAYVCSWHGGIVNRGNVANMWTNIKRRMDILGGAKVYRQEIIESVLADDLDLYCLRHTYCTDLQKAGVPINIARELMGHSSIEITAKIYTHTGSDEAKAAVKKLDDHLAKQPKIVYAKFGT